MPAIAIVGTSGTGKSSSMGQIPELGIEGLDPKETVIINVAGKDMPFKGWVKNYTGHPKDGGNYFESSNADDIAKGITFISEKMPHIKNIVLDDGQYIMAFEFMDRAKENGFGKFADIGVSTNKVVKAARTVRKDLKVYFMWHPEVDKETGYKMKTIGNMVDAYLTLEGLFSVVLYTDVSKADNKMKYSFVTNNNGKYPAKSPVGMFPDLLIPNDLGKVSKAIDAYNNG